MTQVAVWPDGMSPGDTSMKVSPGILSGDHLFVTGMTGSGPDGSMPSDPSAQFHAAFHKLEAVLAAGGLGFSDVVDMTSYHINIREHFAAFEQVQAHYVQAPFPAWTAVGVAELRRAGALVEVKVIARR